MKAPQHCVNLTLVTEACLTHALRSVSGPRSQPEHVHKWRKRHQGLELLEASL